MKQELLRFWNWVDSKRPMPVDVPHMEFSYSTTREGAIRFKVDGLKVWIYKGSNYWVAQGLDIGYAASGESVDDVKKRFERGLFATLAVNWKKHGSVDAVLKPAHPIIWIKWRKWVRENYRRAKFDRSDDTDADLFDNSDFHPVFISP